MNNETICIEFYGDDYDLILEYQKAIGATYIQDAILNAISLALDHKDEPADA